MPSFTSLPGFRDFYPAEFRIRSHIMNVWREVARRYGFEEYDGPPLEPLELYTEKSGEEIVRQLYNFVDKGDREVALRPEMTPTFARMVGARAAGMRKPIRWFSIPQLFRYERTQRGRLREHFQWNVDIVGEDSVAADAEILAVAIDSLRMLGLTEKDIVARVNDRRYLERLLAQAGVPNEKLTGAYAVIDKMSREKDATTRDRFRDEVGLGEGQIDALLESFKKPVPTGEGAQALTEYLEHLRSLGLGDFVQWDPRIVRGLAYYTGIVFEIFDRQGELRAICGGGRYDSLLKTVSNADLPALGFGMGDVVLTELLTDRALLPPTEQSVDYYIVAVTDAEQAMQREVARTLRDAGNSVAYGFKTGGVGKQFKDADARGASKVIVLGPDEVASGVAVVKDMKSGQEEKVPLREIDGRR
ncbi:MAG TPA: histidine--tRNA ligase [Longimicrobiales bacterium]|nr:histidine--tRNA ligase [Longimicrobiales bacterium]